jgi:hypothetical protein
MNGRRPLTPANNYQLVGSRVDPAGGDYSPIPAPAVLTSGTTSTGQPPSYRGAASVHAINYDRVMLPDASKLPPRYDSAQSKLD